MHESGDRASIGQLYRYSFVIIDVLFIYCPIVRGSQLNLKGFTGKSLTLFTLNIDVLFIYWTIVIALSARYYCAYVEQVRQLYTFMQQSHSSIKLG